MSEKGQSNLSEVLFKRTSSEKVCNGFPAIRMTAVYLGLCVSIVLLYLAVHHRIHHFVYTSTWHLKKPTACCAVAVHIL